jgi:hypothetical protein
MYYWNFGRLGSNRRRWQGTRELLSLLQGSYLGLQLCYRFLRGFLELQKLILQVLEIRGLTQGRRDTDDAYQHKLPSCSADHAHLLPRQLDAGGLLQTQNNSAHASRRRVRMALRAVETAQNGAWLGGIVPYG